LAMRLTRVWPLGRFNAWKGDMLDSSSVKRRG
jgi:hypothetical protein